MRYAAAMLALTVAAALSTVAFSDPAPQPSIVPVTWELEFKYQDPRPINVKLADGSTKTFWYMTYTVTNRSGADRIFVPEFTMFTDTGKLSKAGAGVPAAVFDAVVKQTNNPLLVDQATITGKILQGEDNAKDGVAIWPDIDQEARAFDVFVGGLSGEKAKVKLPAGSQPTSGPAEVTLTKALQLKYALSSEPAARDRNGPKLLEKNWVMR